MRKILTGIIFLAALAGVWIAAFSVRTFTVENDSELPLVPMKQEATLLFVGDIMLSRNVGRLMATKEDPHFPFLKVASSTEAASLTFGNLENPVSERGVRSGSIYSFRADPASTTEALLFAGIDVVSLANNHIWDYGRRAFIDTYEVLEKNGIGAAGAGPDYAWAHRPVVRSVGATDIAYLAYTNLLPKWLGLASSTPAAARYDDETLRNDIAKAKEEADVVAVSFHWGDEYETVHNAEQERVAKLAIDAGAKIIVGHHPHVVQKVEEYNGGLILYSLGNFVFDQNFSKDTKRGLAVEVRLSGEEIVGFTKKEVAFTKDFQPYFVEQQKQGDAAN